jgi:hypothetical protein
MAEIVVAGDELLVRLSSLERLGAFRGDVRVPLAAVSAVAVNPDPWRALRGIRAPGTGIPRVIAYGTRRLTGAQPDFAALHGTGPAVVVDLSSAAPFGRLVVTVPDPDQTVAAIRVALTPGAR